MILEPKAAPNPSPRKHAYRAFLLRMWAEGAPTDPAGWRYSLEETQTGARHGFSGLDSLSTFLAAQRCAAESPQSATD